ncbi:MAG: SCP2 sterol-binding domain-containing protein [Thermodesulfobacteriota bacterium]
MLNVPANITIDDLLLQFSPDMAKGIIALSGKAAELAGTTFSLCIDVSGDLYSYVVKDGAEFDVKKGSIANPMVHIKISKEDLAKMIKTNSLDMLLGIQNDLSRAKYDALNRVKGQMTAVLSNDDGSAFTIVAALNGAENPKATFRMATKDSAALMRKEANPVNLFMSGAMKIEGDMAFAMSTQPLFS